MRQYNTSQRQILTEYLKSHRHTPLTADEIASGCARDGKISISAIYRNLAKLCDERSVIKISSDTGIALYKYNDCSDTHLHMQCKTCGKLFHMEHNLSDGICNEILKSAGFTLDEEATVLFGKCKMCK